MNLNASARVVLKKSGVDREHDMLREDISIKSELLQEVKGKLHVSDPTITFLSPVIISWNIFCQSKFEKFCL